MVHTPVPGTKRTRAMACLRRPSPAPGAMFDAPLPRTGAVSEVNSVSSSSLSMSMSIVTSDTCCSSPRLLRDLRDVERARLLRGVRVLGARVDLELGQLSVAQLGAGQHALDGVFDDALGTLGEQVADRLGLEATRVAGVAVDHLVRGLLAGERNLFGVDHDDEVASVHVRR